jgi:hypothetical protein
MSSTPSTSDDEDDDIDFLDAQLSNTKAVSLCASLMITIDSVSAVELRRAVAELGRQMPEAASALIQLLATPASRKRKSSNESIEDLPAPKNLKIGENEESKER